MIFHYVQLWNRLFRILYTKQVFLGIKRNGHFHSLLGHIGRKMSFWPWANKILGLPRQEIKGALKSLLLHQVLWRYQMVNTYWAILTMIIYIKWAETSIPILIQYPDTGWSMSKMYFFNHLVISYVLYVWVMVKYRILEILAYLIYTLASRNLVPLGFPPCFLINVAKIG